MEKVLPINITQHKKDLMWKATKCFVLNMAYHCHKDNNRFPIVYREAYYTRSLIYNGRPVNRKISRTYTLALFDALAHYGLAEFEKGGVETWNVDFDTG